MRRGNVQNVIPRSRVSRFFVPAAAGLLLYLTLFVLYNLSWDIENRVSHFIFTEITGFLYGASILCGAPVIYAVMYFRGAGSPERIAGSFIIIIAWYVKEIIRMTAVYSFMESLFYLLMPMQFGILLLSIILVSLSETGCRFFSVRRGLMDGPILTPPPVVAAAVSLLLLFPVLYRGGESYFFWFYDWYKFLFMRASG